MSARVVLIGGDQTVARKLAAVLQPRGVSVEAATSLPAGADAPVAVVVDLDRPDAMQTAALVRERWPAAMLAAFVSMPDRMRWEEAAQIYDVVATRGAVAGRVATALESWSGPRTATRIRLFEAADAVGRLGVVHRADTPAGPVAVYNIGRELFAVADLCPHAGATLSEGTLSGPIITCPLHSSQFNVRDGSRTRGPSDHDITAFRVVIEDGIAYLELEGE